MELMYRIESALAEFKGYFVLFVDEVDNVRTDQDAFILQSFRFLFFMRDFHAAIFVSPLMSTAEAVSNAVANFRPLAVSV